MLYDNPTFSTPIHTVYNKALATNDSSILDELSMDHVISVFHDYLAQHPEYEFFPNTKFDPLLLQRISTDDSELDFCFFQPENGLELCYYVFDNMIYEVFMKIMEPLLPYIGTPVHDIICSSEQEKVIRNALSPLLNQFPLTQDVLFDSIINYPQRLYF